VLLPAIDAAGGTSGGLTFIDQVTRLMPLRLLAGRDSTSLPSASSTSSESLPNRWRAFW